MNIRYLFIKGWVNKKEQEIKYCPTRLILVYFITKPLQTNIFRLFGNIIMGHTSIEQLIDKLNTALKERVGDQKVKGLWNYTAKYNTTNERKTYEYVVHKRKQWWRYTNKVRIKYVREERTYIDAKKLLALGLIVYELVVYQFNCINVWNIVSWE